MDKMEVIKKRITEDAEFAALVKAAKTPEEMITVLRNAGYDVTEDDIKGTKNAALSDEDLDKVAGGWWIFW